MVRAGQYATYVVNGAGSVWTAGYRSYGQLGDEIFSSSTYDTPVRAPSLNNIATLRQSTTLESFGTCVVVVSNAGNVYYWPSLTMSGSGVGSSTSYDVEQLSGFSAPVVAADVGYANKYHHICALVQSGAIECAGYNVYGALGDGTRTNRATPVAVVADVGSPTILNATRVAAADNTNCASNATHVWCWGLNSDGQVGDGTKSSRLDGAVSVVGSGSFSGDVKDLQCGGTHCCMLLDNGGMACWGDNTYGKLGDGSTTDQTSPTAVSEINGSVVMIEVGDATTCALTTSGDLYCWVRRRPS